MGEGVRAVQFLNVSVLVKTTLTYNRLSDFG